MISWNSQAIHYKIVKFTMMLIWHIKINEEKNQVKIIWDVFCPIKCTNNVQDGNQCSEPTINDTWNASSNEGSRRAKR